MRNIRNSEPNPKKPFKLVLGGCLVLLLLIVAAAFGLNTWYQTAIYSPVSSNPESANILVNEGENLLSVADKFQSEGVLRSVDALRIYLRLNPTIEANIQAGNYLIPKNLNVPQILELIAKGPVTKVVKITIVEGLRIDEIADDIAEAYEEEDETFDKALYLDISQSPDKYTFSNNVSTFLQKYKPAGKNLEGFLYPDAYNIAVDATAQDIIDLQIRTLISRLEENNVDIDTFPRLKSFYEILNLASIVQREAHAYTDMQKVSDVYLKRIQYGWTLNADAALLYPLKRWSPGLTNEEKEIDTPYNSYKRVGLPPTPISNPGIEAISSVVNYEANPYYYYITDKDGIYRYAVTLQEHNSNIARYGLAF